MRILRHNKLLSGYGYHHLCNDIRLFKSMKGYVPRPLWFIGSHIKYSLFKTNSRNIIANI